jgi:putative photosynthetic complex assembly protein
MPLEPHFSGEPEPRIKLPRPVLAAAAGLALSVIILAGVARRTGIGADPPPTSTRVASRSLTFVDREDGGVGILDPATGAVVDEVPPGGGGFVRGVLRALVRERRLSGGVAADSPFVLTRWRDGRLTLDDATTGRRLELTSFGTTNAAVFRALLEAPAGR